MHYVITIETAEPHDPALWADAVDTISQYSIRSGADPLFRSKHTATQCLNALTTLPWRKFRAYIDPAFDIHPDGA